MIGQSFLPDLSHAALDLEGSSLAWLPQQASPRTSVNDPFSSSREDRRRSLDSNDGYSSYLVDADGNQYEPYSLAWRYLGLFVDCGDDEESEDEGDSKDERERHLSSDDNKGCIRKVLWAAYRDPNYSGGSIGEYQYYDPITGIYDESYCRSERCVPLDCHEPESENFELVGVFKETEGLYDFAEQLFKHQGYCLWSENTFEKMANFREYMVPYDCQQLYFPDDYGNTIYMAISPQPMGDMTIAVYSDAMCTKQSRTTIQDYIMLFYDLQGNYDKGKQIASSWTTAIKRWNHHMGVYKQCQPCRAYDLSAGGDAQDNSGSADNNNRGRKRYLDENDGEGDEEQWGYDCDDYAGYTNCNQCYKFETHTTMEPATEADLKAATRQGTILAIRVDGKRYGHGWVDGGWFQKVPGWVKALFGILGWMIVVTSLTLFWKYVIPVLSGLLGSFMDMVFPVWWRRKLPSAFKEHFHIEAEVKPEPEEDGFLKRKKPVSYVYT